MSPVTPVSPTPSPAPVATKPNAFVAFFGSQLFHSLYHAVLAGISGYVVSNGLPAGDNAEHWAIGLVSAALGAVVGWLNGLGNAKKVAVFLMAFGLAANANAWVVSLPTANPITKQISRLTVGGVPLTASVNTAWQPAAGGETDLKLIPTAGLGIGTGENGQPSYGISVGEALILGRSTPASGSTYNFSTYLGIDGLIYADFGPWMNSNFQQPIVARGGFGIIGPDFMGTYAVPSIQALYDFRTGDRIGLLDLTVNFGALENTFGTQVAKL